MRDWQDGPVRLLIGDCRVRLRELPDASVDALVTDPPAGISMMGRDWDTFPTRRRPAGSTFVDGRPRPGITQGQEYRPSARAGFVAFMTEVAAECLRVLKPGAHGLVWAIPRTAHWTAWALEDAGFQIRDVVHHLFGSGFPKSLDVSKAIDRAAGAETAPATDAARQWQGWGTALKPAAEHWILVRKPLAEPNVAANVLSHGTGALNVDGCRVEGVVPPSKIGTAPPGASFSDDAYEWSGAHREPRPGRWPANLVLSHVPELWEGGYPGCAHEPEPAFETLKARTGRSYQYLHLCRTCGAGCITEGCRPAGTRKVRDDNRVGGQGRRPSDAVIEAWECVEGCPVAELDRQSGTLTSGANPTRRSSDMFRETYGAFAGERECLPARGADSGGASRFFYVAKASRADRNRGLPSHLRNRHPTVKPTELMRWLVRLLTPLGGTVLDPFAGSGTTLLAATLEGFASIGIEQDAAWLEIIRGRCGWAQHQPQLVPRTLFNQA